MTTRPLNIQSEKLVFRQTFDSPVEIAKAGGVITGSPEFKGGLVLDGTNDSVAYDIPNSLLAKDELTFVVEFIPEFEADDNTGHYFFDSDNGSRYLILKSSGNALQVYLGGDYVINATLATYQEHWKTGERNVIVIAGTSGDTALYLNGVAIVENDSSVWTTAYPESLYLGIYFGGTTRFKGTIKSLSIYNRIFTADEALSVYDNSLFNFENKADVWLDMKSQTSDGTNTITEDKSGNGYHAKLGDGTTSSTFPAFSSPGFQTDGGDYIQTTDSGILDTAVSAHSFVVVLNNNGGTSSACFAAYEETDLTNPGAIVLRTSTGWQFYAGGVSGTHAANYTGGLTQGIRVIIGTSTGSETCIWVNGVKGVDASAPQSLDITTEQKLTAFARGNTSTSPIGSGGEIFHVSMYPFKLTPIQIEHLTKQLMSEYH